jgi:hypothetical protein
MTIHRLLNYQNFIDNSGQPYYAKGNAEPNWSIYNLVVIDECSMLSNQIITDIDSEIKKNLKANIKIIYVGDPAQLPPVNQKDSLIFNKHIKKLVLDKIIRTNSTNIMKLSNSHRKWIETGKDEDMPILVDYQDSRITLHSSEKEWLDKYVDSIKNKNKNNEKENFIDNSNTNIILTWTNKKCNKYNDYVRHKMFNKTKLNKYEIGEILIFNDFYRIQTSIKNEDKNEDKNKDKNEDEYGEEKKIISFYTSEQIKLYTMKEDKFKFDKIKNLKNTEIPEPISKIFIKTIDDVNKILINTKLQVYYMQIQKISELKHDVVPIYDILSIHHDSLETYNKLKNNFEISMVNLKNTCHKMIKESTENDMIKLEYLNVVEKKINRIWKDWQANIIERFAQLNYGYAITVHKSQGSTFLNVFIDIMDIFQNHNQSERIKCIYTAITRSSNSLELLI